MARSAADATRFTQTTPHAYSRGAPSGTTINLTNAPAPPPNETPQQKVARLREAARQARLGHETASDRWITSGRRFADRAHKVTVTGLVGLSVISIGVAGWSLTSMMLYNRRKRREWLSEQQQNYDLALSKAREAEAAGTLTADLALVLNKERAILAAEEEQKNRKGIFVGAKEWVFGGLAKEDRPSGAKGFAPTEIQRIAEGLSRQTPDQSSEAVASHAMGLAIEKAGTSRNIQQSANVVGPGMLDALAQRTVNDVQSKTRHWLNWTKDRSGPSSAA